MKQHSGITRRDLILGNGSRKKQQSWHHISSAVISVWPDRLNEIRDHLSKMEGVEVHAADGSKIVIIIEGPTTGALGERLTKINLLDGVLSANLVFEQITADKEGFS